MEIYKTIEELHTSMHSCMQTEGMSIWQHGVDVHEKYLHIIDILSDKSENDYNLPIELFDIYKNYPVIDIEIMKHYHVYHDCAKGMCLEIDENGRRHYPEHCYWSMKQYSYLFPDRGIEQFMVFHDMDFHTMKTAELYPLSMSHCAFSLYLTSWAELTSNAIMFGGLTSDSYKIKRKKLVKHLKLFK